MRNTLQLFNRDRIPTRDMFSDFDRLFEQMLDTQRGFQSEVSEKFQVQADIEETDKAFLLKFDIPGIKKEDLKIDVTENVLTVSGERKRESESGVEGHRRMERAHGNFVRTFTLPNTVDAEKIDARLVDGVLNLAIPKVEAAKPRKIEVQAL